jgi:integrase
MPAVPIRKSRDAQPSPGRLEQRRKQPVEPTQKAIDALALNTGSHQIAGIKGLFIRCRAQSKSFYIERRVNGKIKSVTLEATTMKAAKEEALKVYLELRQHPFRAFGAVTFETAFENYLAVNGGKLKPRTVKEYRKQFQRYLKPWHGYTLQFMGSDRGRAAVQRLQIETRKKHGKAGANQALAIISFTWNLARKTDASLPESPTSAVTLDKIARRNAAYSPEDLRAWAEAVSALNPVKKMFYLVALFTGARQGSICQLRREDISLEHKIIKFLNTKRQQYAVPMSDVLAKLLTRYLDSESAPPSEWVFPATRKRKGGEQFIGDVKEKSDTGIDGPNRLRHTFKTWGVGCISKEESKILLGQQSSDDRGDEDNVNFGYITLSLVLDSLRPAINRHNEKYVAALGKVLPELKS